MVLLREMGRKETKRRKLKTKIQFNRKKWRREREGIIRRKKSQRTLCAVMGCWIQQIEENNMRLGWGTLHVSCVAKIDPSLVGALVGTILKVDDTLPRTHLLLGELALVLIRQLGSQDGATPF